MHEISDDCHSTIFKALEMAMHEALTMKARMPEPFASHQQAVQDQCKAALDLFRAETIGWTAR